MTERVVVVGGGPAGLSAARAYRAAGGRGHVVLLAGEPELPYRRPPLTKGYLRGTQERAGLPLEPASFFAEQGIALRLGVRAAGIDLAAGRVVLEDGTAEPFDACVLAPGSEPQRPPIPGADSDNLLTVRTLADADRLRDRLRPGRRAVVIGAGFIGCEAAASLAMVGARVTLVAPEDAPQVARLGEVAGGRIRGWLEDAGVRVLMGRQVEGVEDGVVAVAGEEPLPADVVVLGTGVAPRLELAEAAGLALADGGVRADERLRTSHPAVRVAGDAAAAWHAAAGRRLRVEHWGDALAQGEVAGRGLAGDEDARWDEPPGFWSTIGTRTLKHVAWGDGHEEARVMADEPDRLVIRYERDGALAGLLAHGDDDAYEAARDELRGAAAR